MTDYSVINNVNVFVRFSGFIHLTSRRVLLQSSKRTASTLDHFLVFSGRRPPLRSDHATVRAYDHICRILLKQQTEIDVSGSRCLATTMRLSRNNSTTYWKNVDLKTGDRTLYFHTLVQWNKWFATIDFKIRVVQSYADYRLARVISGGVFILFYLLEWEKDFSRTGVSCLKWLDVILAVTHDKAVGINYLIA